MSAMAEGAFVPAGRKQLGAALKLLAEREEKPDVRAQLHAVAAVLAAMPESAPVGATQQRKALVEHLQAALAEEDEATIVRGALALARHDAAFVPEIDWTAVSGG